MFILHYFPTLMLLPQALACAEHRNYRRMAGKKQDTAEPPLPAENNWTYSASFDWGRIDPAYELCQSGTQQAPIALTLRNGLSTKHVPTFNYPDKVEGNFYNWAFGKPLVPRTLSVSLDGLVLTQSFRTGLHVHTRRRCMDEQPIDYLRQRDCVSFRLAHSYTC